MSACRASAASRGCGPPRAGRGTDDAGPTGGEAGGFSCRRRRTPVNRSQRSNPLLIDGRTLQPDRRRRPPQPGAHSVRRRRHARPLRLRPGRARVARGADPHPARRPRNPHAGRRRQRAAQPAGARCADLLRLGDRQRRGATVLKPNRRELAEATAMPVGSEDEIVAAARALIAGGDFGAVLVSLSEDGMILVEAGGGVHVLPAAAREVYDVSGAGDTVIATLAAALAGGLSLIEAARLANLAAGIVVGKIGTA